MTTATQAQVRSWARAQGMTVNDRGSLPASAVQAYDVAHATSRKGTTVTSAARTTPTRKASSRKASTRQASTRTGPKAAAKPARARKAAPSPVRRAAPARAAAAAPESTVEVTAPPAGTIDLAGGLRAYLGSVDVEVRAVSALSERIDALVIELNDLRDQQAKRLIVLDELRASVTDQSLGSFLDQAIKPRKTRAPEVIPERLL